MTECLNRQYEICERQFRLIHEKLDRLDRAIRGNSQPGIMVRLDRLERRSATTLRLVWLIAGGAITVAGRYLVEHVL